MLDKSYGDLDMITKGWSLGPWDWHNDERDNTVPIYEIPDVYHDRMGYADAMNVANYRWIEANYGDQPYLIELDSAHGGKSLAYVPSMVPLDQRERATALVEIMEGLNDYPLISEDLHSEVEEEFRAEYIECALIYDIVLPEEAEDGWDALDTDERAAVVSECLHEVDPDGEVFLNYESLVISEPIMLLLVQAVTARLV